MAATTEKRIGSQHLGRRLARLLPCNQLHNDGSEYSQKTFVVAPGTANCTNARRAVGELELPTRRFNLADNKLMPVCRGCKVLEDAVAEASKKGKLFVVANISDRVFYKNT